MGPEEKIQGMRAPFGARSRAVTKRPEAKMAKEKPKLVSVRFLKSWGAYNGGELAGFGKAKADKLVDMGVAAKPKTAAEKKAAEEEAKEAAKDDKKGKGKDKDKSDKPDKSAGK